MSEEKFAEVSQDPSVHDNILDVLLSEAEGDFSRSEVGLLQDLINQWVDRAKVVRRGAHHAHMVFALLAAFPILLAAIFSIMDVQAQAVAILALVSVTLPQVTSLFLFSERQTCLANMINTLTELNKRISTGLINGGQTLPANIVRTHMVNLSYCVGVNLPTSPIQCCGGDDQCCNCLLKCLDRFEQQECLLDDDMYTAQFSSVWRREQVREASGGD